MNSRPELVSQCPRSRSWSPSLYFYLFGARDTAGEFAALSSPSGLSQHPESFSLLDYTPALIAGAQAVRRLPRLGGECDRGASATEHTSEKGALLGT